ncbi:PLD nuclease N-terminal domain-containing protein [Georgenia subflava]|nr:PLD nuclease N-terminal domain-containing protein [Georgenia subflava]
MLRLLLVILPLALVIYALIDCARTPDDEMPAGIPKIVWIVLIILFPGIAALAWIIVSRVARSEATAAARVRPGLWSSPTPPRPVRRHGPLAPDDDPDFLARLESERRRAERERNRRDRAEQQALEQGRRPAEITDGAEGAATGGTHDTAPELPAAEGDGLPRPASGERDGLPRPASDEDDPTSAGGPAPHQPRQ